MASWFWSALETLSCGSARTSLRGAEYPFIRVDKTDSENVAPFEFPKCRVAIGTPSFDTYRRSGVPYLPRSTKMLQVRSPCSAFDGSLCNRLLPTACDLPHRNRIELQVGNPIVIIPGLIVGMQLVYQKVRPIVSLSTGCRCPVNSQKNSCIALDAGTA